MSLCRSDSTAWGAAKGLRPASWGALRHRASRRLLRGAGRPGGAGVGQAKGRSRMWSGREKAESTLTMPAMWGHA